MKRIIVTEEQAKLIIDRLISEQKSPEIRVKTVYGGTDANRISHTYLSKAYGLPDGAKHENYYYGANVSDVIAISADPNNQSKFLSVFKPIEAYDKNPKDYYDYFEVNDEVLESSGSKVFRFYQGSVYATHNGLLALARAMVNLGGVGANLKISFGSKTSGDDASKERIVGSVSFSSNQALDRQPILNLLADNLTSIAVNPGFLKNTTSSFGEYTTQQTKDHLNQVLTFIITGVGGFMDGDKKDQIIAELTPKGFITKIDYDLNNIVSQLEALQSIEDMVRGEEYWDSKPKYNEDKRNKLNKISNSFFPGLIQKLKEIHDANFKLYVQNYLPEDQNKILPLIPNTKFTTRALGEYHHFLFHSYRAGAAPGGTQLQKQSRTVGSGKINN